MMRTVTTMIMMRILILIIITIIRIIAMIIIIQMIIEIKLIRMMTNMVIITLAIIAACPANLDRLPPRGATIVALPMKIRGGSGGPLRIVAFL